MAEASYLQTVADPWVMRPGRISDEYQGMTLPMKMRHTLTMTTNTAGASALCIHPNLNGMIAIPVVTTNVANWAGASVATHNDLGSATSAFSAYRIVSMGVKVTFTGSESNASGEIVIAHTQGVAIASQTTALADFRELPGATSVSVAYIKGPVWSATHNFDRPPFVSLGADLANVFPATVVLIQGGTSSVTNFRVEVDVNCEFVPLPGSVFSHLATASPIREENIMATRRLAVSRISSGEVADFVKNAYASMKDPTTRKPKATKKAPARRKVAYKRAPLYVAPRSVKRYDNSALPQLRRGKRKYGA